MMFEDGWGLRIACGVQSFLFALSVLPRSRQWVALVEELAGLAISTWNEFINGITSAWKVPLLGVGFIFFLVVDFIFLVVLSYLILSYLLEDGSNRNANRYEWLKFWKHKKRETVDASTQTDICGILAEDAQEYYRLLELKEELEHFRRDTKIELNLQQDEIRYELEEIRRLHAEVDALLAQQAGQEAPHQQ